MTKFFQKLCFRCPPPFRYVTLSVWPQDNSEKVVEDFWKKFPGWYDARLAPADWMLTVIRITMPNTDTEFLKGIFYYCVMRGNSDNFVDN